MVISRYVLVIPENLLRLNNIHKLSHSKITAYAGQDLDATVGSESSANKPEEKQHQTIEGYYYFF